MTLQQRLDRILPPALAVLAFGASSLGDPNAALAFAALALGGLLASYGVVAVWGARTRPRPNLTGLLVGALLAAALFSGLGADNPGEAFVRYVVLGLLVGIFLAHDHVLGPSLLVAAPLFAALTPAGLRWQDATDAHAWWIATTSLLAVIAASLERDRLHALEHPPIAWPWRVLRAGLLTFWTLLIMQFKSELGTGQLFARVGFDPRGASGRWALLALFLLALVAAVALFRGRQAREAEPPNEPPEPQPTTG